MTFDERAKADPQIGAELLAGARGLAMHRMMRDGAPHWDDLTEPDKLRLITEASAVIAGITQERDRPIIDAVQRELMRGSFDSMIGFRYGLRPRSVGR